MTVLGIFLKHPVPGRVKTRLAADLGAARAAELYAAFIAGVADRFRRTGSQRFLCYTPDEPDALEYFSRLAQKGYQLWPQPCDRTASAQWHAEVLADLGQKLMPDVKQHAERPVSSLGTRMKAFFDRSFSDGAERVVIIGSDSPTLPLRLVEEAFHVLKRRDCVLGPATDGGFYLVGQRETSHQIFHDIQWSSKQVLEQTVARIAECNASLGLLDPWYDVDTLEDLDFLRSHLAAMRRAGMDLNTDRIERLLSIAAIGHSAAIDVNDECLMTNDERNPND